MYLYLTNSQKQIYLHKKKSDSWLQGAYFIDKTASEFVHKLDSTNFFKQLMITDCGGNMQYLSVVIPFDQMFSYLM